MMLRANGTQVLNSRCTQLGMGLTKRAADVKVRLVYWMKEYVLSPIFLMAFALALTVIPEKKQKVAFSPGISKRARLRLKRFADLLVSPICLVIFAPFLVIAAILIRLDSPGPVIYRQVRIGQNRRRSNRRRLDFQIGANRRNGDRRKFDMLGKPFCIYKFRTMVNGAEKGTGPVWARQRDCRITKVGRVLRKKRLDELPQLLNVFMGHMSLVGPRPERHHFIKHFSTRIEDYEQRFYLRPGITGLAQVSTGYDSSVESVKVKTKYDLQYIRHWHMTEDLIIVLKTIAIMLNGKGAA